MRRILILLCLILFSCTHTKLNSEVSIRRPAGEEDIREGFVSIKKLDPKKQTVCSITLNSDNEIRTFQENLPKENFQFVELATKELNWLTAAANAKIRCDILVISGHFGGAFFGPNGELSLDELESNTCSEEGSGIFHSAKEVFLFGCNTLAGKTQDLRTPEQYRQVLIQDNFSPAQAAQIVSLRYSPIGQTFSDRMARVFAGVPRIYGFNSIGPSGEHVEPLLKNYFKGVRNYSAYLKKLDTGINTGLLKALKDTAIVQTTGASVAKNQLVPRCFLENKKVSDSQKIDWIYKTLKNPTERLAHLSAISSYLLNGSRAGPNKSVNEKKLTLLSNDRELSTSMNRTLNEGLAKFPSLRLDLLSISRYFGWLSFAEVQKTQNEIVGKFFEDGEISLEDMDQLCAFGESARSAINYEMIRNTKLNYPLTQVIGCVKPTDLAIQNEFIRSIKKETDDSTRGDYINMLVALAKNSNSQSALAEMLKSDSSRENRISIVIGLDRLKPQDIGIQRLLLETMENDSDSEVQLIAGNALLDAKPQDLSIQQALVKVMTSQTDVAYRLLAFKILLAGQPSNEMIQGRIANFITSEPDVDTRLSAMLEIANCQCQNSKILDALVTVLQNRNNSELASSAADALGEIKSKDPKVLQALVDIARNAKDDEFRFTAAVALSKIDSPDPKIRSLVRKVFDSH